MSAAPDLFAGVKPKVGQSNALFLADLANGASTATLRANARAGKYPGLNAEIAKANLRFWGMT
jgi:hypothetical protein